MKKTKKKRSSPRIIRALGIGLKKIGYARLAELLPDEDPRVVGYP